MHEYGQGLLGRVSCVCVLEGRELGVLEDVHQLVLQVCVHLSVIVIHVSIVSVLSYDVLLLPWRLPCGGS